LCNDLPELFTTSRGLTQADTLPSQLMKTALEVIRDSAVEKRSTIYLYFKSTQILAHAEDIDIIYTSERALKEAFIKTAKEAQKNGPSNK
jgi:hypothetical protein